ncbi:sensor histidine kinase [Salsuginibacillus kocurii]|uniref:sensor histidine kinase n=1 Tax=Salsuginibacillus kocurii TaxID=427078 RepID=UPI0003671214|nr:sensor histidine kinase [Salsuginibacillus kocurii]
MQPTNNLDQVIGKMLDTVSESKEQIFNISEQSRAEYQTLEEELRAVRIRVNEVIDKVDTNENKAKLARNRLAQVSREFQNFSNEEVRKAYEDANEYQVTLAVLQQEEEQLRSRRDRIERRLLNLEETIDRAESLVGQVSVVQNFLTGDLQKVGEIVADAEEKQAFGLKIIEAQEEERKRVARDIHDGPAQMLANVLLRSELVERVYQEEGIQQALAEIRDVRGMVKTSLAEVRRIIYDLRPMALDDLGLVPTLRKYLQNLNENTDLSLRFSNYGDEKRLPPNFEVGLFRLVQEAVQNALKHAEPTDIHVKIEMRPQHINMIIQDNGKGFDQENKRDDSFGLIGMRERVQNLKGELDIQSASNQGTKIIIRVPLNE